jgi:hypothetical protein
LFVSHRISPCGGSAVYQGSASAKPTLVAISSLSSLIGSTSQRHVPHGQYGNGQDHVDNPDHHRMPLSISKTRSSLRPSRSFLTRRMRDVSCLHRSQQNRLGLIASPVCSNRTLQSGDSQTVSESFKKVISTACTVSKFNDLSGPFLYLCLICLLVIGIGLSLGLYALAPYVVSCLIAFACGFASGENGS